jgi:hypothetical protein
MLARMSAVLFPHPSTPATAVERLEVQLAVDPDHRLRLTYRFRGRVDAILWPTSPQRQRVDGLWRHTCFEAFLQAAGGGYREYNLSPSGAWAAYEFSGYRSGMQPLEDAADPEIACTRATASFELSASLDLRRLAARQPLAALRLGLSAVIEDRTGVLSYFALEHPAEKPDFHLAASFVAGLAPMKENA